MVNHQRYLREKKSVLEESKQELNELFGGPEVDAIAAGAAALPLAIAGGKMAYNKFKGRSSVSGSSLATRIKSPGLSIVFTTPPYLASQGEIKIPDAGAIIGTTTGDIQLGDKTKAGDAGEVAKITVDRTDPNNKKYFIVGIGGEVVKVDGSEATRSQVNIKKDSVINIGSETDTGDSVSFKVKETTAAGRAFRKIGSLFKKKVADVSDTTASAEAAAAAKGFDDAVRKLGIHDASAVKTLVNSIITPYGVKL